MLSKHNVNINIAKPASMLRFYEQTSINKFLSVNSSTADWPKIWKTIHFKTYPRLDKVELPSKLLPLDMSFQKTIVYRNSNREYGKQLNINEIATMLYFSSGIHFPVEQYDSSRRVYPSAGARYPIEVYLAVLNVEKIEKGLYHYNVKNHNLETLLLCPTISSALERISGQEWVGKSSIVIILSALYRRTTVKYGYRGFRYCLIEAGHIGQNIYLISTALKLHCCAIGGFIDKKLNDLCDFDPEQEVGIYMLAIGK